MPVVCHKCGAVTVCNCQYRVGVRAPCTGVCWHLSCPLQEEDEDSTRLRHDNLLEAIRSVTGKRCVQHTLVNGPIALASIYTLELCLDRSVCVFVHAS